MRAGDVLFVRGTSLLSKLVRLVDKGAYSHVAIALSSTHILEAQYYTKSRICPIYFEDYDIVRIELTDNERMSLVNNSINLVGEWYDYRQAASYLLRMMFKKGVTNSPNFAICSEIIATLLVGQGVLSSDKLTLDSTPNELYKILKTSTKAQQHERLY